MYLRKEHVEEIFLGRMEHDVDDYHLYLVYPSEQNQCCTGMNPTRLTVMKPHV